MKTERKKIWRRLGAGFLLGLSFLNLGVGWGRQKAKTIPRRTQNLRKRTEEELEPEIKAIADVAEQEAQTVIQEEMEHKSELESVQIQTSRQSFLRRFLNYSMIGGWGVTMAVFFTSMIFNYPFGLGKAVLSLFPGEPHVAVLQLLSEKEYWRVGDDVVLDLQLSTVGEKVVFLRAEMSYDSDYLEFQNVDLVGGLFGEIERIDVDSDKNVLTLVLRSEDGVGLRRRESVARLHFKALRKASALSLKLSQSKSLVLKVKPKDGHGYNILGKVVDESLSILEGGNYSLDCLRLDIVKSRMTREEWERLLKGPPTPLKNDWFNFQIDDDEIFLRCAYSDDDGLYFLLRSARGLDDLFFYNKVIDKNMKIEKKEEWFDEGGVFYAVVVDGRQWIKEKPNVFRNMVLKFKFADVVKRWPVRGTVEFNLK